MKDYAEKENELRNARMILRQELEQKESAKNEITRIAQEWQQLGAQLKKTEQNAKYISENIELFKERFADVADVITKMLLTASPNESIAEVGEFCLSVPHRQSENKPFVIFERLGVEYYVELGNSIIGNKTRIANFFVKFDNQLTVISNRIDKMNEKKNELGEQLKYSSSIAERIENLEKELAEIFDKISRKN